MDATKTVEAPQHFPLPGYGISVGPFSYLAAERDRLARLTWRHFEARQLGATVGAEISGIDLRQALTPDQVSAIVTRLQTSWVRRIQVQRGSVSASEHPAPAYHRRGWVVNRHCRHADFMHHGKRLRAF